MAIEIPSEYGKRLIPQILDNLAATEPDRVILSITKFAGNSYEFQHISAHTLAKAVDKTAWWLYAQVGKQNETKNGGRYEDGSGGVEGIQSKKPLTVEMVGYIGPRKLRKALRILSRQLTLAKMISGTYY